MIRLKNKILLILLIHIILCIANSSNAQNLHFYFNNIEDEKEKKTELEKLLEDLTLKFKDVIKDHEFYEPDQVNIDVYFLDPNIVANLKFVNNKKHNFSEQLVEQWKINYELEDRILFYFIKKDNAEYQLKNFNVTYALNNGQIPELVEEYILNQIVNPVKDDYSVALKNGINALKNAFDQRFKEMLITKSIELLKINYYYRHYAYIKFAYYWFESIIEPNSLNYQIAFEDHLKYVQPLLTQNNNRATLSDYYSDENLYYNIDDNLTETSKVIFKIYMLGENGQTIISSYTFDNDNDYLDLSDAFVEEAKTLKTYNAIEDYKLKSYFASNSHLKNLYTKMKEINEADFHFKNWQGKNTTLEFYNAIKFEFCKVKVHANVAKKGDYIGNLNTKSIYKKDPTWCNKYALDLSKNIYGVDSKTNKSPVPYSNDNNSECTANMMYDFFSSKPDIYIPLDKNKKEIWHKYINNGYPVYFSQKVPGGTGHIETGFPDNELNLGNNKITDDFDVSLSNYTFGSINSGKKAYCVVGAGSTTGFKTFDEYNFLNISSSVFLYLGYLNNEY